MISFLRTASILDSLGCYKLADRFTKVAIESQDFDLSKVYSKPQTFSDEIMKSSIETGDDPFDLIGHQTQFVKDIDPLQALEEGTKFYRQFFSIYPQITLFEEDNIWKFFFTDPLSVKLLDKISNPSGKLKGSKDDLEDETYDVLFVTNLSAKDYTPDQAIKAVRAKFKDASVDFVGIGKPVDNRDMFDEEKNIDLV